MFLPFTDKKLETGENYLSVINMWKNADLFIRVISLALIFFFLGVHKIESDEKQPTYLKQSEFFLDKTHFMNWFLEENKNMHVLGKQLQVKILLAKKKEI